MIFAIAQYRIDAKSLVEAGHKLIALVQKEYPNRVIKFHSIDNHRKGEKVVLYTVDGKVYADRIQSEKKKMRTITKNPRKRTIGRKAKRKAGARSRFAMTQKIRAAQKTVGHRAARKTLKRARPRRTNETARTKRHSYTHDMKGVFIVEHLGGKIWRYVASFSRQSDAEQYARAYHKLMRSSVRVVRK